MTKQKSGVAHLWVTPLFCVLTKTSVESLLQKLCVSLNGCLNPLWFDANVALCNGGGAVLKKPLDESDVVAGGLVDFRSIPLSETVGADALKTQIVTDDGKLLLHSPFRDGEDQVLSADAIPQTVVLDILSDHQRDGKDTPLAGFLLHDLKAEAVSITNNVTGAEFHDVADPQAQVSLQDKGGGDALIRTATAKALFHRGDNFFVLLCGESLCFLIHNRLQEQKVRKIKRSSSFVCGDHFVALKLLVFGVRICRIIRTWWSKGGGSHSSALPISLT